MRFSEYSVGRSAFGFGGGGGVKSIQRGSATINGALLDVTISAVDLTKAIVRVSYRGENIADITNICVVGRLTTATNLRLEMTTYTLQKLVYWEVIEFTGVKSLQKGTATQNGTGIAVTKVNVSKSLLFVSHRVSTNDSLAQGILQAYIHSGGELIYMEVNPAATAYVFEWQLIEFN